MDRLFGINEMVKANCQDCNGCFDCCTGMGDTITLDPLDVHRIRLFLDVDFKTLSYGQFAMSNYNGIMLPCLRLLDEKERCAFLNEKGRCSIHPARPGICRLFPLGRYYENGSHGYFLQENECLNKNRTKIKVGRWIDTPDLKSYEKFVDDWHYFLEEVRKNIKNVSITEQTQINNYLLNTFYVLAFPEDNFYEKFYVRLANARKKIFSED